MQVATKDSGGGTIDSGTSVAYSIKQIGTGDIADNAITTSQFSSKLADNAVTTPKIAGDAVTGAKILDGSITAGDIGVNTITTPKIATDAVTADKIAGVSKLVFSTCSVDPPDILPESTVFVNCPVSGISESAGDKVIATLNGLTASASAYQVLEIITAAASWERQRCFTVQKRSQHRFKPGPRRRQYYSLPSMVLTLKGAKNSFFFFYLDEIRTGYLFPRCFLK